MKRNKPWSEEQKSFLRTNYPKFGARWCSVNMPGLSHTIDACRWKAKQLGVNREGTPADWERMRCDERKPVKRKAVKISSLVSIHKNNIVNRRWA